MRRHHLDALFLIYVYLDSKFCPTVLETVRLRVPVWCIGDFALFNVCSSYKNCPSAGCASAADVVCRDVDVFGAKNVPLIIYYYITVITIIIITSTYVYMNVILSRLIMV
jgi:hypothetical protein